MRSGQQWRIIITFASTINYLQESTQNKYKIIFLILIL